MIQILQDLKYGKTQTEDVPCPSAGRGQLLIRTTRSLISPGTERMLLEFARSNLIEKARSQPERVRQVIDKIRTDGLLPTLDAVRHKLDQPLPLGYCNVGRVIQVGTDVEGFSVGDRVASNGWHAEVVRAPANLCAKIPDTVDDETAAFTVLSAIALQGIRLVQPTLGEAIAVSGLGLVGALTAQLLRSHGCRVLGMDIDPARVGLAREFGVEAVDLSRQEDPVARGLIFSRGRGMDGVIITASTESSEPIHQAALMCRKRGRIVLVGVTGLRLSRADFYEKELSFQVSCSYGPGRYDPNYEERGQDYPVGFVRWTEQRNFEAVLDMMSDGRLEVARLVSHRFPLDRAEEAYELLASKTSALGILIEYPSSASRPDNVLTLRSVRTARAPVERTSDTPNIAFIGAGNHATRVLIPAMKRAGGRLHTVVSSGGVSAMYAAKKFGFEAAATDVDAVFTDPSIDAVVIATRHDTHARFVLQALEAGKHVFVEKPLCLTHAELDEIEAAYRALIERGRAPVLMVGFNRRFAPHVVKMKGLLSTVKGPKAFVVTVNAGAVPPGHWTEDPHQGGGRILGEACHFVDLVRHLAGVSCVEWSKTAARPEASGSVSLNLTFQDGSIGTIHYFTNGARRFPKERIEVFAAGRVLQLDNFRKLAGWGWPAFSSARSFRQDKGHNACCRAFVKASLKADLIPIRFEEIMQASRSTIDLERSSLSTIRSHIVSEPDDYAS
jgi:predicted dehydrogenase/threonine dehydrogenase-like Zn-dependent dehydrogenase